MSKIDAILAQLKEPIDSLNVREFELALFPYLNHPKYRSVICNELLHTYFLNDGRWNTKTIQMYRTTYWKWFVYGMWYKLLSVDTDIAIDFIVYSCTDAFRLGIDVTERTIAYLNRRFPDDNDLVEYFNKLCLRFETNTVPVSHYEKATTHSQIYTAYSRVMQSQDSIRIAEFWASLKEQMVFETSQGGEMNIDDQIIRYVQYIKIFFEKYNILDLIDTYIDLQTREVTEELTEEEAHLLAVTKNQTNEFYPVTLEKTETIEDTSQDLKTLDQGDPIIESVVETEEAKTVERKQPEEHEVPVDQKSTIEEQITEEITAEDEPTPETEEVTKTDLYLQIQSQILVQFGNISTMSPQEISPVLQYLAKEAAEKNDPHINSLIYFDTKLGQFVWNKQLLISS